MRIQSDRDACFAPARRPDEPFCGARQRPTDKLSAYVTFNEDVRSVRADSRVVRGGAADNATDMYMTGTMDTRWNNSELNPVFSTVTAGDFEVIQLGWHRMSGRVVKSRDYRRIDVMPLFRSSTMSVRTDVTAAGSRETNSKIIRVEELNDDLRSSAIRWRDLYEAAARRCADLEAQLRTASVRSSSRRLRH